MNDDTSEGVKFIMDNLQMDLTPDGIMTTMFGEEVPKPAFQKLRRYDVEIDPRRGLLQDLILQYTIELNRLAKAKLRCDEDYVAPETLLNYVSTLVYMRCLITREERLNEYNALKYSVAVPTFISYCLSQMGQAKDPQFGLILVPKYGGDMKALLSPMEMKSISDQFADLEEYGLKQVKGMDKQVTGSIGYMATNLVQADCDGEKVESVVSWRKDHEVFGVISSVFAAQQLHNMFSTYNVKYGYLDEYRLGLSQIVRSTTRIKG